MVKMSVDDRRKGGLLKHTSVSQFSETAWNFPLCHNDSASDFEQYANYVMYIPLIDGVQVGSENWCISLAVIHMFSD